MTHPLIKKLSDRLIDGAVGRPLIATAVATTVAALLGAGFAGVVAAAPSAAAQPAPPVGGQFHAVAPARILDTRIGVGAAAAPIASAHTLVLGVRGHGGIPATGVSAVALHVTVTATTGTGFITVWPTGTARPIASTLNFSAGQTVANSAIVAVGPSGDVDLYNGSTGSLHFVVDVTGYTDQIGGDARGAYGALAPARLLDTRIGVGAPAVALAPGASLHVAVVGHGGVPAVNNGFGYAAAVLNVTAITPGGGGYVTVWADDAARRVSSNLNFDAGRTRANLAVSAVGTGGGVRIYNGSPRPLQLAVDVSGYFSGGAPNSDNQFGLTGPTRILDTRIGVGAPAHAVAAGATIAVSVPPAFPLSAAVINLTVTAPGGAGYLTAWADGTAHPITSSVNFLAGNTVSTLNLVPVGLDGKIAIRNSSAAGVEIIADESGFFTR